jgi:hypothetical protein
MFGRTDGCILALWDRHVPAMSQDGHEDVFDVSYFQVSSHG